MAALAFLMLGFLIGNLVGLSAESVLATLMPLLFAFGGGSAIGFLHKVDEASKQVAFQAILTLSIGCLAGTYMGIAVSEHQLMTPPSRRATEERASIIGSKYLRSYLTSEAHQIDQLYTSGALDAEGAYDQLYGLVEAQSEPGDGR